MVAFAYMALTHIGLSINTLPVAAVGVGVGVDFAIYIYNRCMEEFALMGGDDLRDEKRWHEAIIKAVRKLKSEQKYVQELIFIKNFFYHPDFVEATAIPGRKELENYPYDHVIFSFHGVPERQIIKNAPGPQCDLSATCCSTLHEGNKYCYRAQCYATARLLAKSMDIPPGKYTVTFQSRLGKGRWLQPYTTETVKKLAGEGTGSILVFSPSFVTDCLETTIELGVENKEIFLAAGGKKWTLVKSLNDSRRISSCITSNKSLRAITEIRNIGTI